MKYLINRPLSEIQNKISEIARDRVESVFPNWFSYKKQGDSFQRRIETRYADNDANRYAGYCAAERAVWLAAEKSKSPRDLLMVWNLTIIEHQLSNSIDSAVKRCYERLQTLNG